MKRGFSLVELSIVLVILGLLTGGILAGQSLIRASELRGVVDEYQRFAAATNTFRDRYMGVPGDMQGATRFWQRQNNSVDCVTHSSAAVGTAGVCDGNGDGIVTGSGVDMPAERYQIWRHLSASGLIEGSYTGYPNSGSVLNSTFGANIPGSRLTNAGWFSQSFVNYAGTATIYARDYGGTFLIGASTSSAWPYGPVFKPEEAWNIDSKVDDGRPAYGKVIAMHWDNLCSAVNSGVSAKDNYDASYRLSDNTPQCALMFSKSY